MTKNKKIIICAVLVILIIAIILVKVLSKDNTSSSQSVYTKPGFVDHSSEIMSILEATEEEYQAEKGSVYTRVDFYNTTTLNFQVDGYYIEFTTLDSISKYCTYYDSEGNEVEEIPELEVEITIPTEMEVGNYYLLRYYDYEENYVYYYVTELTDNGFEEIELYLITEGESIGNDEIMIDDVEMEIE